MTEQTPEKASFEYVLTPADESFLWRRDDYPWERNVWNFHPEVEIHLITNASGILLAGDFVGNFAPGDVAIVGSNLPHDWVTPIKRGEKIAGRDIVIQFDPEKLAQAAIALPELCALRSFLDRAGRGLSFQGKTRKIIAEHILEMEFQSGIKRLSSLLSLLHLMQTTKEFRYLSTQTFKPDLERGSLTALRKAFSYIFANLSDEAKLTGMSESAFSRFFKKNCGSNFSDHVNMLRISKAAQLLSTTVKPITDICFEVGYCNLSNFNRMFKREHHLTPSAYRRLTKHRRATRPDI